MNTNNPDFKKIVEEFNIRNKEKQTPYAERLVRELKSNSKKDKI